jgi:hypothetical protein
MNVFNLSNPSTTLGHGVHSASKKNENQKQINNVSAKYSAPGVRGRQPYCHLRADCLDNVGTLTSHNPVGLYGLLQGHIYFLFHYSLY